MRYPTAWRLLLPAATAFAGGSVTLHAQSTQFDGVLTAVWVDPAPGAREPARLLWLLTDERGATYEVELPADLVQQLGGVLAIDRRRVSTRGTRRQHPAAGDDVVSVHDVAFLHTRDAPASLTQLGSRPYAVLLCRFADEATEPWAPSAFATLMGGGFPNVDHYYRENSNDQIDFSGTQVYGWFALPQPKSYYVNDATPIGTSLLRLSDDCTAVADPSVDFSAFHGIITQYNGNFAATGSGSAFGGSRFMALDGVSRVWPMAWMPLWSIQHGRYGVWPHEVGHSLGLPHSSGPYGQVYDSRWDVMSNSYLTYSNSLGAWLPGQTIAHHKNLLGWFPAQRRVQVTGPWPQTVMLDQHSNFAGTGALIVTVPIPGTPDYYTIEARRLVGYDQAIPGAAIVIHRVLVGAACISSQCAYVVDPDNNGDVNDAGAMWLPGETFNDGLGIRVAVTAATATGWEITVSPGNRLEVTGAGSGSGSVAGGAPAINCAITSAASSGTCVAAYYGNPSVTLTATPAAGDVFTGWSGACTGTSTCQVSLSQDRAVTAGFAAGGLTHVIATSANPVAGGTTTGGGNYADSSPVTVQATPAVGYTFVDWTEGGTQVSTSASYSFTASATRTLVANFAALSRYDLSIAGGGSGSGTVTSSPGVIDCAVTAGSAAGSCGASYMEGTTVTLTATASSGSRFDGWTGACSGADACVVGMTQARAVTALFSALYDVSTSSSPAAAGSTSGGGTFTAGSSVTVSATPATGYDFVEWIEAGARVSIDSNYSFVLTANRVLLASFVRQRHAVTVGGSGSGAGRVISEPAGIDCTVNAGAAGGSCSAAFEHDVQITLTATPVAGSVLTGWTGCAGAANSCMAVMTEARSVGVVLLGRPNGLTIERAGDALVGRGTLTAAETEYLDAIGNRNGRFDIGDFLALRAQQ